MRRSGWHHIAVPLTVLALAGCGSDSDSGNPDKTDTGASAQGISQKGPFQKGAAVTARDLLADGTIGTQAQSTTTSDDRGSYRFADLAWQGPTRVRIEGTYFNELTGTISSESRYLDSLLLSGQASGSNINLYTHLQSGRIQTLMQQGQSFADARSQAQQEWQATVGTNTSAAALDILDGQSGSTETDSANLLLFSASVLQAGLDQAALNGIRDDFADDGSINGGGATDYQAVVSAGQTPSLFNDARANLNGEFGVEPASGSSSDFAWIPSVCSQTRLEVGNSRPVLCTGDESLDNLNRSGDQERNAAALVFEAPGHYRIEVSGTGGSAFGGNTWKLSGFDEQDTDRSCEEFESADATGSSTIEGLTSRLNRDERACLETYFAPSSDGGGPSELRVGLIPINDGGPSLNQAVPLTLGETKAGKIGNYVTGSSDFPAYSYYRFTAPSDGTYRITVNGYDNLGSGSMGIALFTDQDNSGGITFSNDQERIDFTGGPGTDSTETVMEKSLGAGTYVVRVFNGTNYRATMEGDSYYLTGLDLDITVDSL